MLDKAQSAKSQTDIANAKEAATLKAVEYIQDYYQGKYVDNDSNVTSYSTAGAYVAKQFETQSQSGNYYMKTDANSRDLKISLDAAQSNVIVEGTIEDDGTITWSDEVASSGGGDTPGTQQVVTLAEGVTKTEETTKEIKITVTSFDKIVPSATNTVSYLPAEKNTVVTCGSQQIVIPAGFKMATDSGTTIEAGMVIKHATDGNEFVWVPVGQTLTFADSTTGQIELGRYTFSNGNTPNYARAITGTTDDGKTPIETYFTESEEEFTYTVNGTSYSAGASVARDIEEFKTNTNNAKGYYIGRYEMGIEGATVNTTTKQWTEDSTGSKNVVCQSGKTVYNYRTRDEALSEAQGLYGIVTKGTANLYASDLVNSYAWDTAIVFIEKCGGNSNYAFRNALTSSGPLSTGTASNGTNNDKQCNIFDMAGNVGEWTTEYSSLTFDSTSYPCVKRGGFFGYSDLDTATRGFDTTSGSDYGIGFRPLLYIK